MYPLRDERLKLKDLVIHWSRDLPQHPSTDELLTDLVQAFWREELTLQSFVPGNEVFLPVRMLEVIDAHERQMGPDADILVGATEDDLPPEITEEDDGAVIVDHRPKILLPAQKPWPEAVIDQAVQVMSNVEWDSYPDDLKPQIMSFLASKEDFARYCDCLGYERPAFWFNRSASPAQVSSNRARTEARKWFLGMANEPKQGTKSWYLKKAKKKFPGLSSRSFDEIWRECAPDAWRNAGKPRSNSFERAD